MQWTVIAFNVILFLSLSCRFVTSFTVINWEWAETSGDDENGDDVIDLTQDSFKLNKKHEWIEKSPPESIVRRPQPNKIIRCQIDKDCGPKKFCHRYYNYCESGRYVGEICRRNGNCMPGLVCMWGSCRKESKLGTENSRCKRDNDCKTGLCCAKVDGESVCKPYLKVGEDCEVPEGGVAFSMNHKCPCQPTLSCKVKSRLLGTEISRMACSKDV